MFQRNIFIMVLIVATLSCHAIAQQGETTEKAFIPNKGIQAFLGGLISTNEQEMFAGTEEQFRSKLAQLENMAEGDPKTLVPELIYFSIQAKTMREAMLPAVLIEKLEIDKGNIARGVLPFLDVQDDAFRKASRDLLGEVEANPSGREPDFSHYESIIRERKADLPKGLINHMYQKSPDAALSCMASVYLDKDEAKALVDQVKSEDAAQAVDRLSKRPEWWAKLYVAEKLKKNPKLHNPELVE